MIDKISKLNTSAINSYKAINKAKISDSAGPDKKPVGTFDMVEIDFEQSMKSAKANIANKLNAATDAEKLNSLKTQYFGGKCPVSAEKIAKSIFGD